MRFREYAISVSKILEHNGVFVSVDRRSEKIGYKIREARMEKIPYLLIVGADEEAGKTVSVRKRGDEGDLGTWDLENFVEQLTDEIRNKSLSQISKVSKRE